MGSLVLLYEECITQALCFGLCCQGLIAPVISYVRILVKPSLLMFLCLDVQRSWFNGGLERKFRNRSIIYLIFWYIYRLVDKNSFHVKNFFLT